MSLSKRPKEKVWTSTPYILPRVRGMAGIGDKFGTTILQSGQSVQLAFRRFTPGQRHQSFSNQIFFPCIEQYTIVFPHATRSRMSAQDPFDIVVVVNPGEFIRVPSEAVFYIQEAGPGMLVMFYEKAYPLMTEKKLFKGDVLESQQMVQVFTGKIAPLVIPDLMDFTETTYGKVLDDAFGPPPHLEIMQCTVALLDESIRTTGEVYIYCRRGAVEMINMGLVDVITRDTLAYFMLGGTEISSASEETADILVFLFNGATIEFV